MASHTQSRATRSRSNRSRTGVFSGVSSCIPFLHVARVSRHSDARCIIQPRASTVWVSTLVTTSIFDWAAMQWYLGLVPVYHWVQLESIPSPQRHRGQWDDLVWCQKADRCPMYLYRLSHAARFFIDQRSSPGSTRPAWCCPAGSSRSWRLYLCRRHLWVVDQITSAAEPPVGWGSPGHVRAGCAPPDGLTPRHPTGWSCPRCPGRPRPGCP